MRNRSCPRPPARSRRVYLRFTEYEYALLQRMCVLEGVCIADLLQHHIVAWSRGVAADRPTLDRWWRDECDRIAREEGRLSRGD